MPTFTAFKLIIVTYCRYFQALVEYIILKKPYANIGTFDDDKWAKVQVFSLSLIFKMWNLPHYRSRTFQQDLLDNLSNVAVPCTGIALSYFCINYYLALFFVLFINPTICLFAAFYRAKVDSHNGQNFCTMMSENYVKYLLHPDDWFSFWQLNCRLASYHSYITKHADFKQEDKWTFLTTGKEIGVPISPFYDDMETLVCKNKNIEGGMGIFFYKNAAFNGDWILQEKLKNSDWLSQLLPENAPLSTMRVITTSTFGLNSRHKANIAIDTKETIDPVRLNIKAQSAVLRLGRKNANTDHSSVLYDVDIATGTIKSGTSNSHWYQLGFSKASQCTILPPFVTENHPDEPYPIVTGKKIPDMKAAIDIVTR